MELSISEAIRKVAVYTLSIDDDGVPQNHFPLACCSIWICKDLYVISMAYMLHPLKLVLAHILLE